MTGRFGGDCCTHSGTQTDFVDMGTGQTTTSGYAELIGGDLRLNTATTTA